MRADPVFDGDGSMDEQKKQKMLVGLLVVAVLGAGSAWYFTSGSDEGAAKAVDRGAGVRKTRDRSQKTDRKVARREKKQRKTSVEKAAERKERKTVDRASTERKKRKRGRGKKEKKQSIAPAA